MRSIPSFVDSKFFRWALTEPQAIAEDEQLLLNGLEKSVLWVVA